MTNTVFVNLRFFEIIVSPFLHAQVEVKRVNFNGRAEIFSGIAVRHLWKFSGVVDRNEM